jgi:hypothetical protein
MWLMVSGELMYGENLNMIHNPGTIEGSWLQSDIKLLALLGFSERAIAVKIQDSSIVHTKQKVPSLGSLIQAIRSKKPLKDVTPLSKLYNYKNFIPLPISLVDLYYPSQTSTQIPSRKPFYQHWNRHWETKSIPMII